MKKEHIKELIRVADVFARDAKREIADLVRDGEIGKYTQKLVVHLEEEFEKWSEIRQELEAMAEEPSQ